MEFRLVPPRNERESDLKTYDSFKYTILSDGTTIDLLTEKTPSFTDSDIASITGTPTLAGKYRINILLTERGKKILYDLSTEHRGQRVAIIYNGKVIEAAKLSREIKDGAIRLPDPVEKKEVEKMAKDLKVPYIFLDPPPPTPTPSSPSEELMRQANRTIVEHPGKRGLYESLSIYQEIITTDPDSEYAKEARLAKARNYLQLRDFQRSLDEYESYRKLYPESKELIQVQINIVALKKELKPQEHETEQKNLIKMIEAKTKQNPESFVSGLGVILGETYYRMGDKEKGTKILDDVLAKLPEDTTLSIRQKLDIAKFFGEQKEYQKALNIATQIHFDNEKMNELLYKKIDEWRKAENIN